MLHYVNMCKIDKGNNEICKIYWLLCGHMMRTLTNRFLISNRWQIAIFVAQTSSVTVSESGKLCLTSKSQYPIYIYICIWQWHSLGLYTYWWSYFKCKLPQLWNSQENTKQCKEFGESSWINKQFVSALM